MSTVCSNSTVFCIPMAIIALLGTTSVPLSEHQCFRNARCFRTYRSGARHTGIRCPLCDGKVAHQEYVPKIKMHATTDGGEPEESIDIDALAKQLSQEAEKLRRSESGKEASSSRSGEAAQFTEDDPIFGSKVRLRTLPG